MGENKYLTAPPSDFHFFFHNPLSVDILKKATTFFQVQDYVLAAEEDEDESAHQRIEELRLYLEEKLGFDRFLEAYNVIKVGGSK